MKNITLLLCVLLSFSVLAQEEMKSKVASNRFDIDVQFLGIELTYKRAITKNFNLGLGTGGVALLNTTLQGRQEEYMEFAKIKIFLEYDKLNHLRIYVGPKLSAAYFENTDTYAALKAIEIGIFTREYRIEFGIELSLAQSDGFTYGSKRLTSSLIVIKIPIKRW